MRLKIKRLITQITSLVFANLGVTGVKTGFCYPLFYCHSCPYSMAGCPIGIMEHAVYKGKISLPLLLYPILLFSSISSIFGRAICGWICPIGLLQRATSRFSKNKLSKYLSAKIPDNIKNKIRYAKYVNLILLVIITPYLIGFMFTDICPVGFLVGTIPIGLTNYGKFVPNPFFLPALVVFILFVVLITLSSRGWCKYFCPLGALMAPFNKISLLHVHVDKERCIHCNRCVEACPMGIDVPNMNRSMECILCGRCIEVCPKSAISYRLKL